VNTLQHKQCRRVLWANVYCLLDTSSGASMSVREMLRQLAFSGYEVEVLGATVFDSASGMSRLPADWAGRLEKTDILDVADGPLKHRLLMTRSFMRDSMTALEEAKWYEFYLDTIDRYKPDLVWFYGGRPFDWLIPDEARARGIRTAAYLVNGNYTKTRWCRDVEIIITDSTSTASYYHRKNGLHLIPVGKFIDPVTVVASEHTRKHILFVNPSLEKGAAIVIQLALALEKVRPDIRFEVVESRGNWRQLVQVVCRALNLPEKQPENVVVTQNTTDMRPVYGRARVVLAPSLWWESGSRVLAEAMLNGIPAIVTDIGGNAEMIGDGGIKVNLPETCYRKPYTELLLPVHIALFTEHIVRFYNDENFYSDYVDRARHAGETLHNLGRNTRRLVEGLQINN
jgi:glycosyltransferase involved in cell wall biosynthesis